METKQHTPEDEIVSGMIRAQFGEPKISSFIESHMKEYFVRWPNYKERLNHLEWYYLFLDVLEKFEAETTKERDELQQKLEGVIKSWKDDTNRLDKIIVHLQSKLSAIQSQPPKSFEECCNEVAKKDNDGSDWRDYPYLFFQKAALLFNSATAAERDDLKDRLYKQAMASCDLKEKYDDLTVDRDRLKEENEQLKKDGTIEIARLKRIGGEQYKEITRLKELNAKLVEFLKKLEMNRSTQIFSWIEEIESLLSKAKS